MHNTIGKPAPLSGGAGALQEQKRFLAGMFTRAVLIRTMEHAVTNAALMLAFTLLWDVVSEPIERAKARVPVAIIAAFLYNYCHAGAHEALHAGLHYLMHTAHGLCRRTLHRGAGYEKGTHAH